MLTASPTKVLENLVQRAQRLYTLPAVAMKVLDLTASPRVDIRSLKDCIENDPALTTKILRVVNSSLFGMTRKVSDLNQALALLGAKPLKMLVLGFSLPKGLLSDVEATVLKHYWGHTLVKAVAAREIAEQIFHQPGDEAFIAGLLQDIGLLVLVQELGEPYCQFLERVLTGHGDLAGLELETLGFDHTVCSARLLETWALPDFVVQAIGTAYDEAQVVKLGQPQQNLAKILHLAELITYVVRQERSTVLPRLLELGERYCRITAVQLETLVEALDQKVPQLAEILSVPVDQSANYLEILAEAHEQLAGLAAATSIELLHVDVPPELSASIDALMRNDQPLVAKPATAAANNAAPHVPTTSTANGAGPGTGNAKSNSRFETSHDLALVARCESAVAECRKDRCSLSVLLVEVDNYNTLVQRHGPAAADKIIGMMGQVLEIYVEDPADMLHVTESRIAFILKGRDRRSAVEFGRQAVQSVRDWSESFADKFGMPLTISAGVASLALPPKNFPATELIQAAERCLSGVQLSGGDSVKSIDMW